MAKRWSKEQIEYLEEQWGKVSIPTIAKNLGRSVNAVKLKALELGLGRHLHSSDKITLHQLARALNKSYSLVSTVWVRHGLPVEYFKSVNRRYKVVDIDKFWQWAEKHRNLIDFSKVEENILGKEPDWVKEKRKADFMARKFKKGAWTPEEDAMLIQMLKSFKYGYREISERLRRSEKAIDFRMYKLGLIQRPLRIDDAPPWTDEEVEMLLDMKSKGYIPELIAEKIGRSALAVSKKIDRMERQNLIICGNR